MDRPVTKRQLKAGRIAFSRYDGSLCGEREPEADFVDDMIVAIYKAMIEAEGEGSGFGKTTRPAST